MATETQYFVVDFDTLAGGSYTAESSTVLSWDGGSSTGFIVTSIEDGTEGRLQCALLTGSIPTDTDTLTQGGVTSTCIGPAANGDSEALLYPAYAREDMAVAQNGNITWTGPALGTTHSFFFEAQTSNVVAGEILTFSGGQQCEVVTVESDAGATGELSVRWISFLDTDLYPDDNDTFTGDIAGDGQLNGVVHPRCYSPLNVHRMLQALATDRSPEGDDFMSVIDATPSDRSTDQIIALLGAVNITDTVAQHMFGGSVSQDSGRTLYSGLDVQITDSDASSNPVIIQDDAIVTAYWENAYMPDSIAGRVRILRKTREDGVDIDGKRVKAKLLEYGDTYFEGSTTLGTASTALALFSSPDGNNQTASGTVAGYSPTYTEGYQTIDYNNGNGAQPYYLSIDFDTNTSLETYEHTKYRQRRGTSDNMFGRNAQLYTGVTLNYAFDGGSGAFTEDEVVAWGTEIPYTATADAAQVWQVDDSGPTFVDQTTGFNDATAANFTPFPATEAVDDYVAIGYENPFARVEFDAAGGTAGVGGVVAWEYWDGTDWVALSGVTDGTTGFTAGTTDNQILTFTLPSDWAANTLNAVEAYYIRARITTIYSTNPVYDEGRIGGDGFSVGEVVINEAQTARGRVLLHDTTNDILVVAQDSGAGTFGNTEGFSGLTSGIAATTGTVVTNSNAGTMIAYGVTGTTTGNHYGQRTRGVAPSDNQTVYGATSLQTADVNGTAATRVINNQFVGSYTGTAYNPANFGIGIDPSDAIASDLFADLLGATQQPPNNQQGEVSGVVAGDTLTVYPWDGTSTDVNGFPEPDFDEMTIATTALTAGVSTTIEVNSIPANTPASGGLRVARDSDGEFDYVEYSSFTGNTFTLVGTAPSNAAIGNNVMRAFIDKVVTTNPESYTAVQTTTNQVAITLRRGGVNPIRTFKGSATFGASGFSAAAQRISDA